MTNTEIKPTPTATKLPQKKSGAQLVREIIADVLYAILAGIVVGTAYHFFQNSNGFAPGGVGGLATIMHHLFADKVSWAVLMISFNVPIFILVSIFINRRLGILLSIYLITQSLMPSLYTLVGLLPYSLQTSGDDFNVIFAATTHLST